VNTLLIQPDQFDEWNLFAASLSTAYNENVTLKKVQAPAPTPKNKKK